MAAYAIVLDADNLRGMVSSSQSSPALEHLGLPTTGPPVAPGAPRPGSGPGVVQPPGLDSPRQRATVALMPTRTIAYLVRPLRGQGSGTCDGFLKNCGPIIHSRR